MHAFFKSDEETIPYDGDENESAKKENPCVPSAMYMTLTSLAHLHGQFVCRGLYRLF